MGDVVMLPMVPPADPQQRKLWLERMPWLRAPQRLMPDSDRRNVTVLVDVRARRFWAQRVSDMKAGRYPPPDNPCGQL